MRVLWLCNIVLPKVARKLNIPASNKEGWLSGVSDAVSLNREFVLGVAFPVKQTPIREDIEGVRYYGFVEDTDRPETVDPSLADKLSVIVEDFKPDIVHIFGTEYPHTLMMTRVVKKPVKMLISIQGVVGIIKDHYFDGLPQEVTDRVTFRDFLKRDSLKDQQKKFEKRAENERAAVENAARVTGRTDLDRKFCESLSKPPKYYFLNETLRKEFYVTADPGKRIPHSIFLSQANYPVKGAHYMLEAMPAIIERYPDAMLYIAGDNILRCGNFINRLKVSSYGKYLFELIDNNDLCDHVEFLGNLRADEYMECLEKASVFVCPSTIENSPNSLGEAMLMGIPCVAARVGGIPSMFDDGRDGLLYEPGNVSELVSCIERIWKDPGEAAGFARNAAEHARLTHDPKTNYLRLKEIYGEICNADSVCE